MRWILETHAHADHLSSAHYLQGLLGGEIAIGQGIRSVQRTFKTLFGLGPEFQPDGSQFDRLLDDDSTLPLGDGSIHVIPTPGHTNDSVSFLVGNAVFIGDTLFMPDSGSARCDSRVATGPSCTAQCSDSSRCLPARACSCATTTHPAGVPPSARRRSMSSVANTHIRDGVDEAAFVKMRTERDATLDVPNLIIPSVQVNIRAGRLPPAEADGVSYFRVPVDVFGKAKK